MLIRFFNTSAEDYNSYLMITFLNSSIKKLKASYNGVLRRLLLIVKLYSASEMFVTHGIPSFFYYFGNVYTVSKSA